MDSCPCLRLQHLRVMKAELQLDGARTLFTYLRAHPTDSTFVTNSVFGCRLDFSYAFAEANISAGPPAVNNKSITEVGSIIDWQIPI